MNNFYEECARLIGVEYGCKPFPWKYSRPGRWNNRAPGSGRYPGFGTIRKYGEDIHVCLRYPVYHNVVYKSEKEVFDFLSDLFP